MKPKCKLCRKEEVENLTSIFGREFTEMITYGMFNPKSLSYQNFPFRKSKQVDVDDLINSHMNKEEEEEERPIERFTLMPTSRYLERYYKKSSMLRSAKEQAWREIVEKVKRGELKPLELPLEELIEKLPEILTEELKKEGLLEMVSEKQLYKDFYERHYAFSPEGQRIISQKVLEEAFMNLERYGVGIHEMKEVGMGINPSYMMCEYDEYLHSYDTLDIQETLISTTSRDPIKMEICQSDLKARIHLHKTKSSNAILLDKSGSMYGHKIRGAMMAALGLKELLETNYKEDGLYVIAFDSKPYLLSSGEITRLRASGSTDIGRTLDLTREILTKEDGNRNIFLITDSEPTVSCYPRQTPVQSALRASYLAGKEGIRINIMMLDRNPILREICEEMARLNGSSTIALVDDPLNLKEFVIKSFIDYKRKIWM
jgi:Ca-activated chloride channel family protein